MVIKRLTVYQDPHGIFSKAQLPQISYFILTASAVFLGLEYSKGTGMLARLNLEILRLLLKINPMGTASITPNTILVTIPIFAPFKRVFWGKEGADERRDDVGDELGYTDGVVISTAVIIAGVDEQCFYQYSVLISKYWILNIERSISISIRYVQYWKILNIESKCIYMLIL